MVILVVCILYFILFASHASDQTGIRIKNSPELKYRDTSYEAPEWSAWNYCPPNQYALGVNVKIETDAGYDDSAINGICFYCAPLGGTIDLNNKTRKICGNEGGFGKFSRQPTQCPFLVTGIQLATDYDYDYAYTNKYGATRANFFCSTGEELRFVSNQIQFPFGSRVNCLHSQAICGIRTQVEEYSSKTKDYAGLLNIEVECCNIPLPGADLGGCKARDYWKIVEDSDNRGNAKPANFSYYHAIGIKRSLQELREVQALKSVTGEEFSGDPVAFQAEFTGRVAGSQMTTGYDWAVEPAESFNEMVSSHDVTLINVPPFTRAIIWQVVGVCGIYEVYTSMIVRVDMPSDLTGKPTKPTLLPGGYFCDTQSETITQYIEN